MTRLLVLTGLVFPGAALAAAPIQDGANLGLGVGGGMGATGLSAKYFIGADFALQGVVGLWNPLQVNGVPGFDVAGTRNAGGVAVSLDALLESHPWINGSAADVAWNGGAGLAFVPGNGDVLGLSVVGGLELDLEVVPIDFVIEYRPNIWLLPNLPGSGGAFMDSVDWLAFTAHLRVYPFPSGPK